VAYPVNTVACAAIWLAARETTFTLPTTPPWWEVFDATFEDIETIGLIITSLYGRRLDKRRLPLTSRELSAFQ
jgi:hypothetical protein